MENPAGSGPKQRAINHSHEATPEHRTYPHQNPPVEQLLKLSQAYQTHAFSVPGCLLFCLCAVAPTQPKTNVVYYPVYPSCAVFGAVLKRQACGSIRAADM